MFFFYRTNFFYLEKQRKKKIFFFKFKNKILYNRDESLKNKHFFYY